MQIVPFLAPTHSVVMEDDLTGRTVWPGHTARDIRIENGHHRLGELHDKRLDLWHFNLSTAQVAFSLNWLFGPVFELSVSVDV